MYPQADVEALATGVNEGTEVALHDLAATFGGEVEDACRSAAETQAEILRPTKEKLRRYIPVDKWLTPQGQDEAEAGRIRATRKAKLKSFNQPLMREFNKAIDKLRAEASGGQGQISRLELLAAIVPKSGKGKASMATKFGLQVLSEYFDFNLEYVSFNSNYFLKEFL